MKKYLIPLAILFIPGVAYLILRTGSNNYQRLEVFGPKEPITKTENGKTHIDTLYHTISDFSFIGHDSSLVTQELFKNKIYCQYQKNKPNDVIGLNGFILKEDQRENNKYRQRNYFLDHFQFDQ